MSDTIKAKVLRAPRPHEGEADFSVGETVELAPEQFARWERRGVVAQAEAGDEEADKKTSRRGRKPADKTGDEKAGKKTGDEDAKK